MQYMIHAAPPRMWYVDGYLVPSMVEQGIPREDIEVWNDTDGRGNLFACLDSFAECGKRDGGTWHLQDDVLICRDFAKRTAELVGNEVINGFACRNFENMMHKGRVPAAFMWYSFPCTYIPNPIAEDFVEWFYREARHRDCYREAISKKKSDDWFFKDYMREVNGHVHVINLVPALVDHVDYLIGGTLVNPQRTFKVNRAANFPDPDLVDALAAEMKNRKR